ncbi:MAG: flagellar hook-length control protein FliK [Ignavibacteriales bacterium]|nr:flagellar hook-length control protein FliK [Ignavibacteriales bacterium]
MVFNPIFVPRTGADVNQDSGKQIKVASANYMFSDIIKVYMSDGSETANGTVQGILAKKYSLAEGEALESSADLSDTKEITTDDGLIISGDILQSTKIQAVQLVEFAAAFLPAANPQISNDATPSAENTTSVIKSGSTQAIQIKNYLPAEFSPANIAGSIIQSPVINGQGGSTTEPTTAPENTNISSPLSQFSAEKIIESLHDAFAELATQSEKSSELEQPGFTQPTMQNVSNKELNGKPSAVQSFTPVQAANVKPTMPESVLQSAHTAPVNQPASRQNNQSSPASNSDATLVKEVGSELGLKITEVKIAPNASSQNTGTQKIVNAENSVLKQTTPNTIKTTAVNTEVNTSENKTVTAPESGSNVVKPGLSSVEKTTVEQEVSVRTASGNTASAIPSEKPSQKIPADSNTVKPGAAARAATVTALHSEEITATTSSKGTVPVESKPVAEYEKQNTAAKVVEPARANNTAKNTVEIRKVNESNAANAKPEVAVNTKSMANSAPQKVSAPANQNSVNGAPSSNAEQKYNSEINISAYTQNAKPKNAITGNELKETAQQQKNGTAPSEVPSKSAAEEISAKIKTPSLSVPHVIKSDMPVRGIKRSAEAAKDSEVKPSSEKLRTESAPVKAAAPNADENVANVVQKGKNLQQPNAVSSIPKTETVLGKEIAANKSAETAVMKDVPQTGKLNYTAKSLEPNAELPHNDQLLDKTTTETGIQTKTSAVESNSAAKSTSAQVINSETVIKNSIAGKNTSGQKAVVGTDVQQSATNDAAAANTNDTKKFGLKFDTESVVKEKVSSSLNSRAQATDQVKAPVTIAAEKTEAANSETLVAKNISPEKLENINIAVEAKPAKTVKAQAQEDTKADNPGISEEKTATVKPQQSNTSNGNMQRDDSSESPKKTITVDKQPVTAYSSKVEDVDSPKQEGTDESVNRSEAYRTDNAAVHREVKQTTDTDKKFETGTAPEKETAAVSKVSDKTLELNTKETGNTINTKNTFAADAPPTHMRTIRASEAMKEVQTLIESRQKDIMVFQLDPENMGKMKVTLTNMENVLRAHIEVETESARKSLEGNMQQLLQKLESAGVQVHSVQITLQQQDQGKRQPQYTNKRMNYNAEDEPAVEEEIAARELGYNTVEYLV